MLTASASATSHFPRHRAVASRSSFTLGLLLPESTQRTRNDQSSIAARNTPLPAAQRLLVHARRPGQHPLEREALGEAPPRSFGELRAALGALEQLRQRARQRRRVAGPHEQ